MGIRALLGVAGLLLVAGCATLGKGAGAVDNPIVVGTVSIASQNQCAAYAADHPADAATLKAYLTTLASAANGCVAGLATAPVPPK